MADQIGKDFLQSGFDLDTDDLVNCGFGILENENSSVDSLEVSSVIIPFIIILSIVVWC